MSSKPPAARLGAPGQQQEQHEQQQQHAAPAPLRMPHEEVWQLLEQPCVPLEPAVVCKLLCVSSSMERLVHSTCRGRLSVELWEPAPLHPLRAVLSSWPAELALARWLAKHAVLLHSFSFEDISCVVGSTAEAMLSAAFAAASEACAGRPPRRTTRQQAAAMAPYAAIIAAAAATASGSSSSSSTGQGLPLQSLIFWQETDGAIVCSLAGSRQLTSLELQLSDSAPLAPGARQALASLTGLQELRLRYYCSSLPAFDALAPALKSLSGLTYLQMETDTVVDNAARHLPASLLQLYCGLNGGAGLRLGHLQSLTRLTLTNCIAADCLEGVEPPARLRELRVETPVTGADSTIVSLQPVVGLESLTRLELTFGAQAAAQLHDLVGMSQLQELHVRYEHCNFANMSEAAQQLQALPFKSLEMHWSTVSASMLSAFAGCTQLTRLVLTPVRIIDNAAARVPLFASGLKHLTALQQLHMAVSWSQRRLSWAPVAPVVAQLPALRELLMRVMPLGASATSLAAATQLTRLELRECGLDEAVKSALCAGLTQLSDADLVLDCGW